MNQIAKRGIGFICILVLITALLTTQGWAEEGTSSLSDSEDLTSAYPEIASDTGFPQSLAAVANGELFSPDACENPVGSDSVKYNRWFYERNVSNEKSGKQNIETYGWNTVFACWCADQIGLIHYGGFPKTQDSEELYCRLVEQLNLNFTKEDILNGDPITAEPSDLIFIPNAGNEGYTVGIVVRATPARVDYILGDVEYGVGKISCLVDDLSDGTHFIRLSAAENCDIYSLVEFFFDRLDILPAASCGMIADILTESKFDPKAIGDEGTSFGICQWRFGRWDGLISFCEENGYNWRRLKGQMEYLVFDLETNYPRLLEMLRNCENSAVGAYQAAYYFSAEYEMPYGVILTADACGRLAADTLFPKLMFSADNPQEQ